MQKLVIYAGVALLLIVGGAMFTIDSIARSAIETGLETGLGVPAEVGSVRLRLWRGSFRMHDLEIPNPEGFAAEHFLKLGTAETTLSYRALREGDVVLKRLVLSDLELDLEWQGRRANYDAILDGIEGSPDEAADSSATETRFIIDELVIQNVVAHLRLDSALGSLKAREVKLEELRLEGIGRKTGGIGMGELARRVVKALLAEVMQQGTALGPEFSGKLAPGLEQLGELGSGSTSDKIRKATEFFGVFGKGREDGS